MLKTLHTINSALLAARGVVHTSLTPVFYGRFSAGQDAPMLYTA